MTSISLHNSQSCIIAMIELSARDATGEAIARATIELIEQVGSLSEGDTIRIREG